MSNEMVDMIIIGGGPTGIFGAFYAGMRQASVRLIDSMPELGGQLAALYPEKTIYDVAGFPEITAQQLVERLKEQMNRFPVKVHLNEKVMHVAKLGEAHFEIVTNHTTYPCRSVIITSGAGIFEPRRLELPKALEYEQSNLYYFIQDMQQFHGKKVVISGGGDSAVDWALMLEPIAKQVILIHRRDQFRAHEHSVQKLMKSSVQVCTPKEITALHGETAIEAITVTDMKTKEPTEMKLDALIVNHGAVSSLGPITKWGITVEKKAIVVDTRMETNISGIFAAGDIATYPGKLKLIAVALGEAPTAINNAKVYIDPAAKLSPGHSSQMKF